MVGVVRQQVIDYFFADSLSLAVQAHSDPDQIQSGDALLVAESLVDRIGDLENRITNYGAGVAFFGNDYFVVDALPELLHDEASI